MSKTVARHHIVWSNPWDSSIVRIRITHTRDYLAKGEDHLAIESVNPPKAPTPLTETGYLSHFITAAALEKAGGPKAFVAGWLQRESFSPDWQKRDLIRRQGDLFKWADAQAEAVKPVPALQKPDRAKARAGAKQRVRPKAKGSTPNNPQ
ncbi:MAG: hypothetical protein ACLP7P_20370 [Rhodomicrobium sp.]